MSDIVVVANVTKRYGSGANASVALDGLTLHVHRNEYLSLMGPSGSGKTTVLNLIAGLDTPDSGEVTLDGHRLSGLADHELSDLRLRMVGFVFQSFNLLPALTVADNVGWPLEFSGCRRAEVRRRTGEALERVGMAPLPERALRRRATACGNRAGDRDATFPPARRRAHRQSRLAYRPAHPRSLAIAEPARGRDGRDGDPRRAGGNLRRPHGRAP
jgi:ABC-type taurine transport system ATPase subunit